MNLFKDGMTIRELISTLQTIKDKDVPVLFANDEEQNIVYKGFYIDSYKDSCIIAGLSGCEE